MIHQRQGLLLRLEPRDDVFRIHSGLDYFESDLPPDRLPLFSHKNHAPTAFANLLQ